MTQYKETPAILLFEVIFQVLKRVIIEKKVSLVTMI